MHLKREKLYDQMAVKDLKELDPDKLLLFLSTETQNGVMIFAHYSEFLNIVNTVVFFYV
jgi:hypothetical protein